MTLYPPQPLIERTRFGQAINFDFEIHNRGQGTFELKAVKAAVRDRSGAIVQRLEINDNGSLPGIATVPNRTWKAGENRTIPNPFHTLSGDIEFGRIDYEFEFADDKKAKIVERSSVQPAPYRQKTRLILPLPGRVLVWDGHDYYSHHRRWDFSNPAIKRMGLLTNPGRYSFDFVIADADARFHSGSGAKREEYFSYGASVVAPGDGVVVSAFGDAPNEPADPTREGFSRDPMFALFGNYVVIDHGNGEYSQLGHLKQGSVSVRKGDRVRRGQKIGEAGASGTSLFPHLHYQLASRPGVDGEGLPARFDRVTRILGSKRMADKSGWIDSGDLVESGFTQSK